MKGWFNTQLHRYSCPSMYVWKIIAMTNDLGHSALAQMNRVLVHCTFWSYLGAIRQSGSSFHFFNEPMIGSHGVILALLRTVLLLADCKTYPPPLDP